MEPTFPYVKLTGTVLMSTPANPNGEKVERDIYLRVTGCHRSIEAVRRAKKPGHKVVGYGNFPNKKDYNDFAQELTREYDLQPGKAKPTRKDPVKEKVEAIREQIKE